MLPLFVSHYLTRNQRWYPKIEGKYHYCMGTISHGNCSYIGHLLRKNWLGYCLFHRVFHFGNYMKNSCRSCTISPRCKHTDAAKHHQTSRHIHCFYPSKTDSLCSTFRVYHTNWDMGLVDYDIDSNIPFLHYEFPQYLGDWLTTNGLPPQAKALYRLMMTLLC